MIDINFKIDEQSEAFKVLDNLSKPLSGENLRQIAIEAEETTKKAYFGRYKYPETDTIYSRIKKEVFGNTQAGEFTRATYEGITGKVDNEAAGEISVSLEGRWPRKGINIKEKISLGELLGATSETDYLRKQSTNSVSGFDLGAMVTVDTGKGLRIVWDKPLKEHFKDIHVPAVALKDKTYGEFGKSTNFMYLTNKQATATFNTVSGMYGNILGVDKK